MARGVGPETGHNNTSPGGAGLSQEPLTHQSTREPSGSPILVELHKIWLAATADSISHDLDRATELAEQAPGSEREEAARYVAALWRLERWLHDR